jgi:hypothetical protein
MSKLQIINQCDVKHQYDGIDKKTNIVRSECYGPPMIKKQYSQV